VRRRQDIPPLPSRSPSTPPLRHPLWLPRLHSKVRNPIFPFNSRKPNRSTHRRSPDLSRPPRPPRRLLHRSSHLHELVVGFVLSSSSF
jgi:hypothetical protein